MLFIVFATQLATHAAASNVGGRLLVRPLVIAVTLGTTGSTASAPAIRLLLLDHGKRLMRAALFPESGIQVKSAT